MIRFSHVTKEFPRTGAALTDVSFQLAKGEFAFLTGPSGAGKSTILKLILMEERPTTGEVRVSGVLATQAHRAEISRLRRRLGVVFQDFRLLEDRTAEANIAFALEVTGAARETIAPRVSRLLTQVGLASKGTARPQELSGGEQQRVAIARAIVHRPALLLADEPTGNLDRATAGEIVALIDRIHRELGTTVVMVTHDQDMAGRVADRMVHLCDGRTADQGGATP